MIAFLPGAPRGTHERLKKKATQHSKNTTKTSKHEFCRGPGPSLQKSPPKTAKKLPPGGQNEGAAQEGPGATQEVPRRPQERAKSRPEAVSEQPWWPSGAQEAPPGLPFRSFQRFLRSLAGSRRKRKSGSAGASAKRRGPRAKDSRQQGRRASRTRGPGGICGAP